MPAAARSWPEPRPWRHDRETLHDATGHAGAVEIGFFDEVAEAVRGLVTGDRMGMRQQARRWGLKAWFGAERPAREHYEAQLIAPDGVDGATVSALEIGFTPSIRTRPTTRRRSLPYALASVFKPVCTTSKSRSRSRRESSSCLVFSPISAPRSLRYG